MGGLAKIGVVGKAGNARNARRGCAPALVAWSVGGYFCDDEAPAVHVVRDLEAHASHVAMGHLKVPPAPSCSRWNGQISRNLDLTDCRIWTMESARGDLTARSIAASRQSQRETVAYNVKASIRQIETW